MSIAEAWLNAKKTEEIAVKVRRDLEDQMVEEYIKDGRLEGISALAEGTKNFYESGYEVKMVFRMNRKVDAAKLQDLAAEYGLTDHLEKLFRWKPEIAAEAWEAADPSITNVLLDAVTTTSGRPTFRITLKD